MTVPERKSGELLMYDYNSIKTEVAQAIALNLHEGAIPIKKIETEHITAYWVGTNVYRIDIKVPPTPDFVPNIISGK